MSLDLAWALEDLAEQLAESEAEDVMEDLEDILDLEDLKMICRDRWVLEVLLAYCKRKD